MFYLTMLKTYFIYGYIASDIVWYRTTQIVRKQGFFYMHHPTDTASVTPLLERWLEREIAQ